MGPAPKDLAGMMAIGHAPTDPKSARWLVPTGLLLPFASRPHRRNQAAVQQAKKNNAAPGSSRANGAWPPCRWSGYNACWYETAKATRKRCRRLAREGQGGFYAAPITTPRPPRERESQGQAWEGQGGFYTAPITTPKSAHPAAHSRQKKPAETNPNCPSEAPERPPSRRRYCRIDCSGFSLLLHTLEHASGRFAAFLRWVRAKKISTTRFCMENTHNPRIAL